MPVLELCLGPGLAISLPDGFAIMLFLHTHTHVHAHTHTHTHMYAHTHPIQLYRMA